MEPDLSEVHRQFPAAPEYLSSIYIIRRDYELVTNARLAVWMGVSAPAVSQALGRLHKLQLANHERYGTIQLTHAGELLATKVLRRHYLIEHLLVRLLGYPWAKADEGAKELQSVISDDLTEHLYVKLGRLQTCPHGNPMPGAPVERDLLQAAKLSEAPLESAVHILRITEEGEQVPRLLAFCDANGVRPGARFVARGCDELHVYLRPRGAGESGEHDVQVPIEIAQHIRFDPS